MSANNIKENSVSTFNKLANSYDSTFYGRHAGQLYDRVIEKLDLFSHDSILDVGCGTGTILSMIHRNQGTNLCGLDLSPEMIKIAREKLGSNAELKIGDSEQLPWADNSFDVVLCTDSFHHYPNPENVFYEMKRVLKSNGHLIIGDPWAPFPLRGLLNLYFQLSNSRNNIFSKREFINMLKENGFLNVQWQNDIYSFIVASEVKKAQLLH